MMNDEMGRKRARRGELNFSPVRCNDLDGDNSLRDLLGKFSAERIIWNDEMEMKT
jgi:hypothetical protein